MTSVTSEFKNSKRPVFTFLLQVAGAVSKHLGLNLARCTKAAQLRGSVLGPTRSNGPRDVHVSNLLPDFSLDCQTVDPNKNILTTRLQYIWPFFARVAIWCYMYWMTPWPPPGPDAERWGKMSIWCLCSKARVRKVMRVMHFWVMGHIESACPSYNFQEIPICPSWCRWTGIFKARVIRKLGIQIRKNTWVCLKMGYTPNEIAIFDWENDH